MGPRLSDIPHWVTIRLSEVCCTLKIIRSPGSHLVHEQFFGNPTSKKDSDGLKQALPILTVTILLGQLHGHTQSPAAGDDGYLVHWIGLCEALCHHSMARLMERCIATLFLRHHHGPALCAHHDLVLGALKVVHIHQALVAAGRKQSRFINQISQIRTSKSGATSRENHRIDVGRDGYLTHVHAKNLLSPANVRQRNNHLTIKAAGAEQRRIKNVRPVGCRNHDNAGNAFKAVHLDEQLVECLLPFIISAAKTCTTLTTDSINFINEDNARSLLLCLLEHIPNTRSSDTNKHLNKIGA
jgi:hypothetical protein